MTGTVVLLVVVVVVVVAAFNWPTIKAWFSDESEVIAGVVRGGI